MTPARAVEAISAGTVDIYAKRVTPRTARRWAVLYGDRVQVQVRAGRAVLTARTTTGGTAA